MFTALLDDEGASRAQMVIDTVLAHGLRCALAGGLAIAARLHEAGRPLARRDLHDIDLVVDRFADIPGSLADAFLLNHVHPDADEGKTLLQLIDGSRAVRVDLFRAYGRTMTRSAPMAGSGGLPVLSVEDLVARSTALVCGQLRRGRAIDRKHVESFSQLDGLGDPIRLAAAWQDHHEDVPGSIEEARTEAAKLRDAHPELLVIEDYSAVPVTCDRCRVRGNFRAAAPEKIVQVLGYW